MFKVCKMYFNGLLAFLKWATHETTKIEDLKIYDRLTVPNNSVYLVFIEVRKLFFLRILRGEMIIDFLNQCVSFLNQYILDNLSSFEYNFYANLWNSWPYLRKCVWVVDNKWMNDWISIQGQTRGVAHFYFT